jgi:hypothetical protein
VVLCLYEGEVLVILVIKVKKYQALQKFAANITWGLNQINLSI